MKKKKIKQIKKKSPQKIHSPQITPHKKVVVPSVSYSIAINPHWCKKCLICIEVCPKKVFEPVMAKVPLSRENVGIKIARPQECIGCKQCEMMCPDFTILVEQGHEKAKHER